MLLNLELDPQAKTMKVVEEVELHNQTWKDSLIA